jgi:hypothetical protein
MSERRQERCSSVLVGTRGSSHRRCWRTRKTVRCPIGSAGHEIPITQSGAAAAYAYAYAYADED